jgi:tetratricopeptide (TPR) repeat protein
MLKITILFLCSSFIFGLFVGTHLPHIVPHRAFVELASRPGNHLVDSNLRRSGEAITLLTHSDDPLEKMHRTCDWWLENVCFKNQRDFSNRTDEELYSISRLKDLYNLSRESVRQTVHNRHYTLASKVANIAIDSRSRAQFHTEEDEYRFAYDLVTLGRYRDALNILDSLEEEEPSRSKYPKPGRTLLSPTWQRFFEKDVRAQALMGLHKYSAALLVFRQMSLEQDQQVGLGQFYLALLNLEPRDDELALKPLLQTFSDLETYSSLSRLKAGDFDDAQKVTSKAIAEAQNASDGIPELELFSDVMQHKGFIKQALELSAGAQALKKL